jgi:GrpB-like predicted nucleotidyltransferase (UPF0157 family)
MPNHGSVEAPVEVVAYDPDWPQRFAEEEASLAVVLKPWLVASIEHVGSTAVPGLMAKPIIDIAVPVASLSASREAIDVLKALSYQYFPYRTREMHWFCKPEPARRTHHLHMLPHGSAAWQERLAFRDALRENHELAAKYAALKQRLSARFQRDREAYTTAKAPFIVAVLRGQLA